MLKTNLKYFYTTIADGNMNTNKNFYPDYMTREDIKADFKERRIKLGERLGFDGLKILTPIQKSRPNLSGKTEEEKIALLNKYNSMYEDGHSVFITNDMIYDYNDLYDLDIYADILMMDDSLRGVAFAYPVADCPVIIAEDKKNHVVSFAHCGGEYIDRDLPGQVIDSLYMNLDSNPSDINVYIGPHALEESFTYDTFPKFIRNEGNWVGCLREDNGLIHINMDRAIMMQLYQRGVSLDNINSVKLDTITNPMFYSNNRARFDKNKAGRFYTGCFYDEVNIKTLCKTLDYSFEKKSRI